MLKWVWILLAIVWFVIACVNWQSYQMWLEAGNQEKAEWYLFLVGVNLLTVSFSILTAFLYWRTGKKKS